MSKKVNIQANYVGSQPIISILEANLDSDEVSLQRQELAVKAVIPINLVISAAKIYAIEKFLLAPLLDPVAEKLDWVKATKKLLKQHQPFNLTINIDNNEFIQAPIGLDHELVSNIWKFINMTIEIVRDEGIIDDIGQIRITSSDHGNPNIILYKNSRPWRMVSLDENCTILIEDNL